ncbi:hypothetical protein DXA48_12310 [Ruminococcus sp. OF02-6]|nr:hypothetical protein DXA48_12310 [Ruminococcus sp. OF02-6]
MANIPIAEVVWFPKWDKQAETEYKDTVSDAMFFEPEWTKKIRQCEAFLEFIKGMEGKDLVPYLSGVSVSVGDAETPTLAIKLKIPLQTRLLKSD